VTVYLWRFIHNALVHGLLMSWPWEPLWVTRLHDWTASKWDERQVKGSENVRMGQHNRSQRNRPGISLLYRSNEKGD
jgi:hypothetical protein